MKMDELLNWWEAQFPVQFFTFPVGMKLLTKFIAV